MQVMPWSMSSSQLTGLASYTTADTLWVHYMLPDQRLITKPKQGLAGAACLTLSKLLLAPQPQPYKGTRLAHELLQKLFVTSGVAALQAAPQVVHDVNHIH